MNNEKEIYRYGAQIAPNRFLRLSLVFGIKEVVFEYDYDKKKDEMFIYLQVPTSFNGNINIEDEEFLKHFQYKNMVNKILTSAIDNAWDEFRRLRPNNYYKSLAKIYNLPYNAVKKLDKIKIIRDRFGLL